MYRRMGDLHFARDMDDAMSFAGPAVEVIEDFIDRSRIHLIIGRPQPGLREGYYTFRWTWDEESYESGCWFTGYLSIEHFFPDDDPTQIQTRYRVDFHSEPMSVSELCDMLNDTELVGI